MSERCSATRMNPLGDPPAIHESPAKKESGMAASRDGIGATQDLLAKPGERHREIAQRHRESSAAAPRHRRWAGGSA